MIGYRALVAVVALMTAFLVQATVVGPAALSVPVSLPLVVVLAVAVRAGPGAGIALGFCAGLLADLASTHAIGLLALMWMSAGMLAGVLGGGVVSSTGDRVRAPVERAGRRTFARRLEQSLLVAVLGAVTPAVAALAVALTGAHDPIGPAMARCVPAGLFDGLLALVVMPLVGAVLNSTALHSRSSTRPAPPRLPTLPLALPR